MIRALLLLFDPVASWERVLESRRGIIATILVSLLPLLLLAQAGECYGLTHWGKMRGDFGRADLLPAEAALRYGIFQLLLNLVVVFVGAFLIKAIGDTFHGRHSFSQAFTTIAYGLSPYFTVRLLNALSREPWWLTWALGILFALSVLYTGIPHIMKPDPTHALGLYFMSALVLLILTGLASFFGYMILQRQFQLSFSGPPTAALALLN
jgi:hypothetical protein